MIRPASFGFNPETAESNAFQSQKEGLSPDEIKTFAQAEFDNFVAKLKDAGVDVIVVNDTETPVKPDAVFPNNWFSTHEGGTLVLYPMMAPNRRLERRNDIMLALKRKYGFDKVLDYSPMEEQGIMLEGTGSLILDRTNKIAYACLSDRTDEDLMDRYCKDLGFKKCAFHAADGNGHDIYHTNVMMALGEDFVVICLDAVRNIRDRAILTDYLEESGKTIITISFEQMNKFAGNMLQVRGEQGKAILVMSETAYQSLSPEQIDTIEFHSEILVAAIPTIETYGGGSVRCMMAEIFY
jgi:hypothetical protein